MSVHNFDELIEHIGHKIVCVGYGGKQATMVNVAIECETCNEVLLDYDREIVDESKPDYQKAYHILMEYWDSLPDDEKPKINKKLKEVGL